MMAVIIYFTQDSKKRVLINDTVYEDGREVYTPDFIIKSLLKREFVNAWVKYYSDSSYTVENPTMDMSCRCSAYQLLHGNPNCPDHGTP